MAETSSFNYSQILNEVNQLLWGSHVKYEIFKRWSQGFFFSSHEKSALEQFEGGPCAVIAPVQAFILKNMLLEVKDKNFISNISDEKCHTLLVQAMCEILSQSYSSHYCIVHQKCRVINNSTEDLLEKEDIENKLFSNTPNDPIVFHESLNVLTFTDIKQVEEYYMDNIENVTNQFGVLLFLYSVIVTKGIDKVKTELSDTSEPLIHDTYGYGSQGLINLMLTGQAVAHVWDNEQDIGGLKLKGITQQSEVGFITLMEHMRYCTVGSFFKSPKHPVWVLGSETHLTVLFSTERKLVSAETQSEKARRIFKSFDPDGNNFINAVLLQDVLNSLDLVSEPEYVEIMKRRLDPENLGIILLNAFMDEFFQREECSTPDTFVLMHYNGLPRSNADNKVKYSIGMAVLLECEIKSICESNPMLTCLQTKWPNIDVNWNSTRPPSLN